MRSLAPEIHKKIDLQCFLAIHFRSCKLRIYLHPTGSQVLQYRSLKVISSKSEHNETSRTETIVRRVLQVKKLQFTALKILQMDSSDCSDYSDDVLLTLDVFLLHCCIPPTWYVPQLCLHSIARLTPSTAIVVLWHLVCRRHEPKFSK